MKLLFKDKQELSPCAIIDVLVIIISLRQLWQIVGEKEEGKVKITKIERDFSFLNIKNLIVLFIHFF